MDVFYSILVLPTFSFYPLLLLTHYNKLILRPPLESQVALDLHLKNTVFKDPVNFRMTGRRGGHRGLEKSAGRAGI